MAKKPLLKLPPAEVELASEDIGGLMSSIYGALFRKLKDEDLAAVATAEQINEILESQEHPEDMPEA